MIIFPAMPRKKPLLPRPLDFNQTAFRLVRAATGEPVENAPMARRVTSQGDTRITSEGDVRVVTIPPAKNAAAVTMGRKGGKKGGKARAAALSPRKRKAIAKKAATTRWDKRP